MPTENSTFRLDFLLHQNDLFWLGLALFVAGVGGELCWRHWRTPRITGYTLVGLIAGPLGLNLVGVGITAQWQWLLDFVVALTLLELGGRLNLSWLRANPWLIASSIAESAFWLIAVIVALYLAKFRLLDAFFIGLVALASAPTVLVQTCSEGKSEGQVAARSLTLSAMNTTYALVLLHFLAFWFEHGAKRSTLGALGQAIYWILGSLFLAYALAKAARLIYKIFKDHDQNALVFLAGLVLMTASVSRNLHLSSALIFLWAGVMFKNIDKRPQPWPSQLTGAVGVLASIAFFIVPMSLQRIDLHQGWSWALLLILVRVLTKPLGILLFYKPSGLNLRQGLVLGSALLPMAVLSYTMLGTVSAAYPQIQTDLVSATLCAIVFLQLLCPILISRGLIFCDEYRA